IGVAMSWTTSGGSFTNISTVSFTGSSSGQTITSRGSNFKNIKFTGSGYWTLQDTMTVTSTMTISAGTLDPSSNNCTSGTASCDIKVGGSWSSAGGTFVPQTSTVTFNSAVIQTLDPRGINFYNITFNSSPSGGSWLLLSSMTVTNNITLAKGTL